MPWQGVEPATLWPIVRHANHYTTRAGKGLFFGALKGAVCVVDKKKSTDLNATKLAICKSQAQMVNLEYSIVEIALE